jgi:hypothetical protein
MKINKEVLFGIVIMIIGSFVASDGIVGGRPSYITIGFILCGFAVLLWIEGIGTDLKNSILEEMLDNEDTTE